MSLRKILLITKREYLRVIRNKAFWLAALFFPLLLVGVSLISGLSSSSIENKIKEDASKAKLVLILDETKTISPNSPILQQGPFKLAKDFASGKEAVIKGEANAFIYYPANLALDKKAQIFAQDDGILSIGKYNTLADSLIKQSILQDLPDQKKAQLFNIQISFETINYKKGVQSDFRLEKFIIPIITVVAYFMLTSFGTTYLLQSVAEEKENRMIEIVLSIVKPKELILGKILGLVGIVLTQVLILVFLSVAGLTLFQHNLQINLSQITINPVQLLFSIFYLIAGYLFIANIMVGVGASMPTYKEASSFSSVFILLAVFPLYFVTLILAEPSGPVAMFTSYFPFSASMILLFRNALGEMSTLELIFSSIVLIIYIIVSYIIAYKFFEFGSLEYSQRISLQRFLKSLKKKKS